jgi:hypothetical protein
VPFACQQFLSAPLLQFRCSPVCKTKAPYYRQQQFAQWLVSQAEVLISALQTITVSVLSPLFQDGKIPATGGTNQVEALNFSEIPAPQARHQ